MLHSLLSVFPFLVCLFWTAVFLLEWCDNNPAKRVLTLFMGTCTVLYFCHALFFNGLSTAVTDSIYDFCNVAVFPLYLIYIYRLTGDRPVSRRHTLLLMPAVAVGITGLVLTDHPALFQTFRMVVAKAVFLLQLFPICRIGTRRLSEFDRRLEDFFSNTETRSVKHTRQMMLVLFVCSCCSAVASIVGREHFFANPSLLFIPSLFFGSLLFVVGFVGQKQVFCASDIPVDDLAPAEETSAMPQALAPPKLLAALAELMESEHLYLQPDLRLSDVANRLGVSRTTLSTTINQSAGISFSDYVNVFRVRHAQEILRKAPGSPMLSVIQIAEQSGFTSESSFYRAFRKATGMTPKQWICTEMQ